MTDQKKKLLRAKVALALRDEFGRRPTEQEIERFTLAARVLYKAVLALHFERKRRQADGQLALF